MRLRIRLGSWIAAAALSGCAAGSVSNQTPASGGTSPSGQRLNTVVSGAQDSVESIPGSPDAPYVYRFRMTDPGGEGFNYQDRDLSFYFHPQPDVLYFQVENRQNRLV